MKISRILVVILILFCCKSFYSAEKMNGKDFFLAANSGDSEAQYKLGVCYYNGYGVNKSFDIAVSYFKKAALQNHVEAQFMLGKSYLSGKGVDKDYQEAVIWLKKSAEQNYIEAFYELGLIYQRGSSGIKDFKLAENYFRKAVAQNHEKAKIMLYFIDFWDANVTFKTFEKLYRAQTENNPQNEYDSAIFYLKNGGDKYLAKALEYLKKSADKNFGKAQYKLFQLYCDGLVVEQDLLMAEKYLLAAEKNCKIIKNDDYIEYLVRLGKFLCKEVNNKENFARGVTYLKQAAEFLHPDALWILTCYNNQGVNMPINYADAVKYATPLAQKGHVEAKLILGVCYLGGLGVKADYEKSFNYLVDVSQKYPEIQVVLADCYWNGIGTSKNQQKAMEIYNDFARKGNPQANYKLALCYKNGWNVKKNQNKADDYFLKAAEYGHVEAMYLVGVKNLDWYNFTYIYNDYATNAFKYLSKAVDKGYEKAYIKLGECYEKGIGTEKNFEKAMSYYNKCQGNLDADTCYRIANCYKNRNDNSEYIKWLSISANMKKKQALADLGDCYYEGKYGVTKNYSRAEEFYKLLFEVTKYPDNKKTILFRLADCYKSRGAVKEYNETYESYLELQKENDRKEQEYFELLKRNADSYDRDRKGNAAFEIAKKYGWKLTVEERCKYLEKAIAKGHEDAKKELESVKLVYHEYLTNKAEEQERKRRREAAAASRAYRQEMYRQEEKVREYQQAVEFQEGLNTLLDAVEIYNFMENTLPVIVKTLED